MLKDKIDVKKKDKSQPELTFHTRDLNHNTGISAPKTIWSLILSKSNVEGSNWKKKSILEKEPKKKKTSTRIRSKSDMKIKWNKIIKVKLKKIDIKINRYQKNKD
jgi:hypothetical protein